MIYIFDIFEDLIEYIEINERANYDRDFENIDNWRKRCRKVEVFLLT